MRNSCLVLLVGILLMSCSNNGQVNKRAQWKSNNYIDSVQILLTNEYKLDHSLGYGASSFLIKANGDTFLCTAKHLLGEAMGISPEIKTERFNSSLGFWKAYPRNNKISSDTIVAKKLITEKENNDDIILQSCKLGKENDIVALTPRFSRGKKGERFEIIGCEYSDSGCHQRRYFAIMDSYEDGQIWLKSEINFTPNGFSGAPVIDDNGSVIGLLSGGGEFEGELYLLIEPITKIKSYLE